MTNKTPLQATAAREEKVTPRGSQRAGFEPARGDPIGFQVQRLNHSAIAAAGISVSALKPLSSVPAAEALPPAAK